MTMAGGPEKMVRGEDPMRLCPECRMPISILANRCRYCGSTVGKPRKETETLTVQDLGGESRSNYTVSGNVKEAIQSFMTEEKATSDAKAREREQRRGWFGRKKLPVGQTGTGGPTLPPLDTARQDLASSLGLDDISANRAHMRHSAAQGWTRRAVFTGAIIVGLAILWFGGSLAYDKYLEYQESNKPRPPVYPNRAEEMLAAGRPVVEALEEALTAVKHTDTPEYRAIAETMRVKFIEDVGKRLQAVPYDRGTLESASTDALRVRMMDTDERIAKLMERVNEELNFHKFVLTGIDEEKKTATFRLNNPNIPEREQTVSEGEHFQNRFIIKRIGPNFVRLEDPRVVSAVGTPRSLIARIMMPVSGN
jgi:hypothetical protein